MKVLITGGAGFVGSHLAEAYIARGDEVYVIDDLSTGHLDNVLELQKNDRFHLVIDTILNRETVLELVGTCDAVCHLAAAVGVNYVIENPMATIHINVQGTEMVLEMANKFKKKVLIASTSEVYGKNTQAPLTEDMDRIMGPTTITRWSYACTKALDEFSGLAYWKTKRLPVVIARLFNTVGPRQTGRYGMVLPRFVKNAVEGRPLTVYGDGSQSRTFSYVSDVVRGIMALVDEPRCVGEIFNVGGVEEITILGLAEKIKEKVGSDSPIIFVPYDEAYEKGFQDMMRRVPSLEKIRRYVGYEPRYSLDDILDGVIEHHRR